MKINKDNFDALVAKAMQVDGHVHMRPVIEKELLHYDILFALDHEGLLANLTFQGGTCLRLCYGAYRFSEDLDFVGGKNFKTPDLIKMKTCIENYIGERYGLEVFVKEPKELLEQNQRAGISVEKWQVRVVTAPERPDLPKQMIKIEVANVPAYTRELKTVNINYDFLPDGYTDTLIGTESLDEIMADKLVSLPSCQKYIRYRDIWDLYWLKKQQAKPDLELVNKKVEDYRITNFKHCLDKMLDQLPAIIQSKDFKAQMQRFIPVSAQQRTLQNENFYQALTKELVQLLDQLQK